LLGHLEVFVEAVTRVAMRHVGCRLQTPAISRECNKKTAECELFSPLTLPARGNRQGNYWIISGKKWQFPLPRSCMSAEKNSQAACECTPRVSRGRSTSQLCTMTVVTFWWKCQTITLKQWHVTNQIESAVC